MVQYRLFNSLGQFINCLCSIILYFYTSFFQILLFGLFENSRKKVKKNVYGETSPSTSSTSSSSLGAVVVVRSISSSTASSSWCGCILLVDA